MNEKEAYYKTFVDNGIRISPKQAKINFLSAKYGWNERNLARLTSKQLSAIRFKPVDNSFDKI